MTHHKIIKATTTHYVHLKCRTDTVHIAVDQDLDGNDRFSLYDGVEPCSGVLTHWGSKAQLRAELMELVQILDEFSN
jgi:hypothetical protein